MTDVILVCLLDVEKMGLSFIGVFLWRLLHLNFKIISV